MTSALDDERMGAASPWMVSWLKEGAAAAQAASERVMRPLIVKRKEGARSDNPATSKIVANKRLRKEKKNRNPAAIPWALVMTKTFVEEDDG